MGAAGLSAAAASGSPWGMAGVALWLVAFVVVIYRFGARRGLADRGALAATAPAALALALPYCSTVWALAPRVLDPDVGDLASVLVAVAAAAGWAAVVLVLRLRRRHLGVRPLERSPRPVLLLGTGLLTVLLFGLPFAAHAIGRRALASRIHPCADMRAHAAGASQSTLRILAEACGQRSGPAGASAVAAGIPVDVFPGKRGADVRVVAQDAEAFVAHAVQLLGRPEVERITISPVAIPGPVRGMAGPGFLLIDSAELPAPRACRTFRLSAGVEGTCGTWVVAHELAHLWFPGRAAMGSQRARVAWEATADYLAWDWWREAFGAQDAARLRRDLLQGRMLLATEFAATHAPADPPARMTDFQERALIRGKGPLGLVAAEEPAGRDAVMMVLREAFNRSRAEGLLDAESILDAAEDLAPGVARVLNLWWRNASPPDSETARVARPAMAVHLLEPRISESPRNQMIGERR